MNYIMVVNAGSSSIKFRLYKSECLTEICSSICERIAIDGIFKLNYSIGDKKESFEEKTSFINHEIAVDYFLNKLLQLKIINDLTEITGVGHRVVQGGAITKSSIIDNNILDEIEKCIKLAPLHNKPELDVIKIIIKKINNAKNVAVFDTSFHATIPKINSYYPIPKKWIDNYKIKKYGFHGTSYRYILEKANEILAKNRPLNLVICHLGNGASICCIKNDVSYDTTMGFTPLAGLVMGTRCGDIDPSILDYLITQEKNSIDDVFNALNKESGVKSICNASDFRDISANCLPGNDYEFARDLFCQKIANYICIYMNLLECKIDAIIFTGGIGENDWKVRENVCEKIFIRNIKINSSRNKSKYNDYNIISSPLSQVKVLTIRTNEELKIAQDTKSLIEK